MNRFKASDLADRGIPAYTNEHGDVAPVTDETGAALLGKHGNIGYDSQGRPRQIAYGETGPPVLKDPFAALPSRTDAKTGAIEKTGPGGLYQYLGQDPVITAAAAQQEKDKAISKEAALVGRKLTLDEHDLTAGKHDNKALTTDLQQQVPALLDPKFAGADQGTVMKAIDEHFNAQYGAPEANATSGFFGHGDLTPEAQTLRASIDAKKAKAMETATGLYALKDNLNSLNETVAAGRQTERDQVETLLAHQRGEAGPLDEVPPNGGTSAAPGLYPPVEDQPRMLGGQALEPDKIIPALGTAGKVKQTAFTPREQLDAPYEAGQPSFRVGDDHSFHLDPNNMMKGLRQGIEAGIVDPEKAKALTPDLRKVQDAINEQRKVIDESGGSKVAAAVHGASLGAAFMAGFAPGAEAGAAGGAKIAAVLAPETAGVSAIAVPAGAIIGGLISGSLTAYGAKKAIDKIAETNDTIRTFTDAAAMHPYYDAAGNLVSFGAGIPTKLAEAGVAAAAKTGSKVAQSIAESYLNSSGGLWKTVTNLTEDASIRKAGGATSAQVATALGARVGGAAAVNVAIDTVLNEGGKALGLQQEGETLPKAAMAALIGAFVSGHGIKFKTYQPAEMAGILVRAKEAMNAGKDINTVLSKPEAEAFNAFSTELKRKINTGEIPVDTEAVTGIVRQALQGGGKNYGVSAAEIIGKGGKKGLPEGPTAPKAPPAPKTPTAPEPSAPTEKVVTGKQVASNDAVTPETAPETKPSKSAVTPKVEPETTGDIKAAEKAFVEKGGHADKLDAQNKLTALREAFPDPAARIKAINERLASNDAETPDQQLATAEIGQEINHPVVGKTFEVNRPGLTIRDPERRVGVKVTKITRGEDTRGGSRMILIHFSDGHSVGLTAGQHSHGHVTPIDESIQAALKGQGANANYEKGWNGGKTVVEFKNPEEFAQWVKSSATGKPATSKSISAASNEGKKMDIRAPEGETAPAAKGKGDQVISTAYQASNDAIHVPPDFKPMIGHEGISTFYGEDAPAEANRGFLIQKDGVTRFGTREEAAKIAVANGEAPKGTTKLKSEHYQATGEPLHKPKGTNEQKTPVTQGKAEKESAKMGQPGAVDAGPARTRISTAEEAQSGLEKSKEVHSAEISQLGAEHSEQKIGRTGIAAMPDGSGIAVDHDALGAAAQIVHDNGGDSQAWLQDAHKEELIHYRHLLALGPIFNLRNAEIWKALPEEARAETRVTYPDSDKAANHAAEYIRMVAQYRETGRITESHHRDVSRMEMFLKAQQPPQLEMLLKSMAAITAGEKAPTDAPAPKVQHVTEASHEATGSALKPYVNPSKAQKRANGLIERLSALKDVPASQHAVITTLLRSTSTTALNQAESRISKLENAAVTKAPENIQGKFPAIASQELIDKGKKAFEGLFAGLPRYEGQVATKGGQVSEGDVEELRKSNEARLGEIASNDAKEPLGAAKPIAQLPIPKDKRAPMFDLIDAMEKEGITTPEKVAAYLEAISGGKARPFSQSLWDMMAAAGAVERGTHDWPSLYQPSKASFDALKPQNAEQLSQAVTQTLRTGPLDRRALTELAKETGLSVKQVDEAAEAGIVMAAREIAQGDGTVEQKYDRLVELYDRQPNLTAKTSTSKVNQAYSTPAPLAFAAGILAGLPDAKSVYEPTAGNGMLLIAADPGTVHANEMDPARVANLERQGFKAVTSNDALALTANESDAVIENPPFGRIVDDQGQSKDFPLGETGQTTKLIDQAIALHTLQSMSPDGRSVLLLGGKNFTDPETRAKAYATTEQMRFWKPLYEQYNVVDHFTINGDLYSKMGAGWPVDVVVIAGRGKSPIVLPNFTAPRILNSWDELRTELGRTDADRIAAGRYDVEKDRERVGGIIGAIRGIAGAEPANGGQGRPEQSPGQPRSAPGSTDLARPDQGQQPVVSGGPVASELSESGKPRVVGTGTAPGQPEQSGQQLTEDFRVPYKPASKLDSFKIFIPRNMEVPAREALASLEASVGPIDEYVRGKLGYREDAPLAKYFSAEQMDALALGINAIENQTAFVLGDQGGVGKGRVAAGMMRYAIKQGKLPIFITKDVKLYAAMIEDLHDIGSDDITPIFTDNDVAFVDHAEHKWKQGNMTKVMREIAKTGKLTGADALFTTYSQIQTDLPPKYSAKKAERYAMKAQHQAPPDGPRMEALKRLAPGSVIIADESHLAAGDSIRAWRLAPLLAQAHGVYYSSATFAKRPDSMGIYSRTSLSHATNSTEELVDAMRQGGVPLQQVVSATLAADGLYLRRERDFSKAVFRTHINTDTRDRDTYLADNYTDGLRSILSISNKMEDARKQINRILRREGKAMHIGNAPKVETTNFASKLHNLISQYLFAIKAESMVRRAVEGVTKGFTNAEGETKPHKVIVAFQNTMEQPILALERSKRPLTFNGMLLHYLDSQRELRSGRGPTAQVTIINDTPDPEFENLSDHMLEKILIGQVKEDEEGESTASVNEKALAELFRRIMAGIFKETEAKLEALDLADMPLSPIDHIKRHLTQAGIKNEEITKRGTGIDEDGAIYKLHPSSNTKAAHLRYLNDFNNGDTDALLINASGSTGISAHSSSKFKRTDPRAMIIGQPHLDINEFMQTTYRIDRTGQVHQPYYELLQTAIPAELRPAAILGKKMSALNANTTSNAESEISEGNKGTDIFNQYGDEVVYNYLKSDPSFTAMLDMPKIIDENGNIQPIDDVMNLYENAGQFAAAVTGRAAVLPTVQQEIFWEKVMADYVAHIDYLNELGENELVSDTVDLKAETLESKELTPAKTGKSGFDAPSQMEKIKADIGLKPLPATEVVTMMNAVDGDGITKRWTASFEAWKKAELTRLSEKVLSWDDEKAATYQARWREQEEEISASLALVGRGLHLKTEKGLDGYGAITAVHLDEEHPLTPSKQIFTIAVNTTKKTIRVPASQLPTIGRIAAGNFEEVYEATAERSNQRYMVTGNLLAAYLAIKDSAPTAKIVQYTTDKGDLRQGILMPAKFTPSSLAKKRVVESPKHMLELLNAGRSLTNAGSEVTLVKAPSGGFVLRVPSSKVMGGAYWRDSQLAKLMDGGEFVERGGAMVGKFGYDNSHLIYQRLLDLGATLFYTDQPESEALGAARPIRAAKEFKDQVTDVTKDIGLGLKESLRMVQHLVSPTTGVAMDAQDQVMRMLGTRNQKAYETDRVLEAASASFDAMPRPEQISFIDRMKQGEAQPSPELQAVAETMRKIDTESWNAATEAYRQLGFKNPPLQWLENHYRVLWKKIPGDTEEEKSAWIGKSRRGLRGSMGQHKQHTLDTMSEGLEMGGVPYSYNPVTMFKLAQADLWKLTSTLRTWKWAKDHGFVEFVRGAFPKAPDGMVELDDSIARVYFPADSGEGLVQAGRYFVEEGFGRLLNNYLSKDFIRQTKIGRGLLWIKNATTALELSISAFHGVFETLETVGSNVGLGLSKLTNRGILKGDMNAAASGLKDVILAAISPVTGNNLGAQLRRAAGNPEAFFKTAEGLKLEQDYPGARQAINALWVGGWKPNELEQDWKNNSIRTFVDAMSDIKAGDSDNYIGAGLRAFPAANEFLMKPLFDYYIPNLKVAQFFKEFLEAKIQNERKLKGGVLTEAALARQVWRFVEDRFGEMNFDTIFWNSNFKTAMQLMFRSVTWKLGSVEAFAGAFGGQAKEFKDAFKERRAPELHRNTAWLFGMFLLTATLGAIISQVLGQKKPKSLTDFVFPQIDPKDDKVRVSLPTYFKDAVHLWHSPLNYVTASMSGWIGRLMDLLRNKDYYGTQIRDTDDPATKQALEVGKYAAQSLLPFSVRGYQNLRSQDVNTLRRLLAVVGVNPAPRYIGQSAAEQRSEAYWKGTRAESGQKPGAFETAMEKRKLVSQLRHGEAVDISKALTTGVLKPRDVKPLYQRAQMGALASQMLHMPLEEAERVYALATPKEKLQLAPVIEKKRANSYKRNKIPFSGF